MSKLEAFQHKHAELQAEFEELETEKHEVERQLDKVRNEKMAMQAKCNLSEKENQALKNQKANAESAIQGEKQESTQKQANLLREVQDMQAYIDELTAQLSIAKQEALQIEAIKEGCYKKIQVIKNQEDGDDGAAATIEAQKARVKERISRTLVELSDISLITPDDSAQKALEINLLISQIVCEVSKLYEKQIVLEKKKASEDFKKCQEKSEKQKQDIKQLQHFHSDKMKDYSEMKEVCGKA